MEICCETKVYAKSRLTPCDHSARSFTDKKNWQDALDVYTSRWQANSKDDYLTNNAVFVWDSWARPFFAVKDWPQAIRIYEKALEQFPDRGALVSNLNYWRNNWKRKSVREGVSMSALVAFFFRSERNGVKMVIAWQPVQNAPLS